MKLILKSHEAKIPKLYATENVEDPIAYVKLFNPAGLGTWYITEYDPVDKLAFGYVEMFDNELGYFSITELEEVIIQPFGLGIERDTSFQPTPLSEIRK